MGIIFALVCTMIHIREHIDTDQSGLWQFMAICPACGQKLTEVRWIRGAAILRIKCRRCKQYVSIDLTGYSDKPRED